MQTLQLWHAGSGDVALWFSYSVSIWDLSSLSRDRTSVPWIARQILNPWTTRGSPSSYPLFHASHAANYCHLPHCTAGSEAATMGSYSHCNKGVHSMAVLPAFIQSTFPFRRGWCSAPQRVSQCGMEGNVLLELLGETHSSVLAWRIQGRGSLVGCRLWGHTESDTTEVT